MSGPIHKGDVVGVGLAVVMALGWALVAGEAFMVFVLASPGAGYSPWTPGFAGTATVVWWGVTAIIRRGKT